MLKKFSKKFLSAIAKPLRKKNIFITSSLQFFTRSTPVPTNQFDYIRLSALELAAHEITARNLKGNVAELGVYRGGFAKFINTYFPNRLFYLFDTFEGFDKRDVKLEQQKDFSTGSQDFSNTSIESVLKIMPYPEKCIPKKGYFPESAANLEDIFVFVSIDADLYTPIYEGLKFFYPRLVNGGYIFIHDFNNEQYKGARKAVEQFCKEQHINFVPIADSAGTAIITK